MKIQSFRIELDDRHEIAVDELPSGLNVLHGKSDSSQSLLHAGLADRLFGRGGQTLRHGIQAAHVSFSSHGQAIKPTWNMPAALALSPVQERDLPLLRQHYALDSLPGEERLMPLWFEGDQCLCGQSHRTVTHIPTGRHDEIAQLEQRRLELRASLEQLHATHASRLAELAAEDRQLVEWLEAAAHRLQWLSNELHRVQQRIAELEQQRDRIPRDTAWISEEFVAQRSAELDSLQQEIARWEQLLGTVRRREQELERAIASGSDLLDGDTFVEAGRTWLSKLEHGRHESQRYLLPSLCNFFSAQQHTNRQQSLTAELAGVRRVAAALVDHLHWLGERRASLTSTPQANQQLQEIVRRDRHADACRCSEHGEGYAGLLHAIHAELVELQGVRQGHFNEQESLHGKRDSWQARRSAVAAERNDLRSQAAIAQVEQQLESCKQQLASLRATVQATRTVVTTSNCTYLERASHYLRELTGGYLVSLTPNVQTSEAWVSDRHGDRLDWRSLSISGKNMVRLSLSLAAVEGWERHGVHLPLLLDDLFVHLKPHEIGFVADCLRRFAHGTRQVLLFTSTEIAYGHFAEAGVASHLLAKYSKHQAFVPAAPEPKVVPAEKPFVPEPEPVQVIQKVVVEAEPVVEEEFVSPKVRLVNALRAVGIDSTWEFLECDPVELAVRMKGSGYSADELLDWQHRTALLYFVPELTDEDIDVLFACDIFDLELFSEADIDLLHGRMLQYLRSDEGTPYRRLRTRYERPRLRFWRKQARKRRDRCRQSRYGRHLAAMRTTSHVSAPPRSAMRSERETVNFTISAAKSSTNGSKQASAAASSRSSASQATVSQSSSSDSISLKFYLELGSPVVDAPTIGPKMAERLEAIGIHTVADLLRADAASIVARLKHRRTKVEDVEQWQKQSRLMCSVPELRGHDAQILCALNYHDPEELAAASPEQLYAAVKPFAKSKEGLRFIRNMNPPDLAEVKDWIRWAQESRVLKAA